MEGIHAVPLDTPVQGLAGITTPAGIDIGIDQDHLLNVSIFFLLHCIKDPIKECL